MARYAVFEDASSTTYGATGNRPIWQEVDTDDVVQLAANTPSGYDNLLLLSSESMSSHYITWNGSAFETAAKESLYDFTGGFWNIDLYIFDLANIDNMDLKEPPEVDTTGDFDVFTPAVGFEDEWCFEANGTVGVSVGTNANPLPAGTRIGIAYEDPLNFVLEETPESVTDATNNYLTLKTRGGYDMVTPDDAEDLSGRYAITVQHFMYKPAKFYAWGLS